RGIDLEREQIADRVAILDAVQTVQRWTAWIGMLGCGAIEVGLDRRGDAGRDGFVRPRPSDRRHRARADLAGHLLQRVGVLGWLGDVQLVEREPGGLQPRVVAGDAVLVEDRSRRLRRLCSLYRLS